MSDKFGKKFEDLFYAGGSIMLHIGVLAIIAIAASYLNSWLIIPSVIIVGLGFYFLNARHHKEDIYYNDTLANVIRNIERSQYFAVSKLDLGMAVFSSKGELQWYNELFEKMVGKNLKKGMLIKDILPLNQANGIGVDMFAMKDGTIPLSMEHRFFNCSYFKVETLTATSKKGKKNVKPAGLAIYLQDVTETHLTIDQFENNKLCLAYVRFDNMESVLNDLSELNKANIIGEVNSLINKWASSKNGFVCRQNSQQSLVGLPSSSVQDLIDEKFSVLDEVKKIRHGNKIAPTLSIGIGCDGATYEELAQNAEQQLYDVISRGGDQALVLIGGEQKAFGGTSPVQQNAGRVQVRTKTQIIRERIQQSDKIFIMGHKQEDFDAIGALIGMAKYSLFLGKSTHIVISDSYDGEAIAKVLEDESKYSGEDDTRYLDLMVKEKEALSLLGEGKNLLILVDHHRPGLTASKEVLDKIDNRVIIDHHRRASDIIGGNVLTYLEPNSSSTCEMVAEMASFLDEKLRFTVAEATLLYAGIALDTKQFVVQTGTRTFEAAAFLKEAGADLEKVRWLFKEDYESGKLKAQIYTECKRYEPRLTIAKYENADPAKRKLMGIMGSQVADYLITLHGISSAVTLISYTDGTIGLNARSDGSINIHVIIEGLGGGGHQYVAGAQFPNKKFEVCPTLKELEEKIVAANKVQWELKEKAEAKLKAEAEAKLKAEAEAKAKAKEIRNYESNSID